MVHINAAYDRGISAHVAIITGGTSGIGRATALLFASAGAAVAISGRRTDRGEEVVSQIRAGGGQALFLHADHTKPADCGMVVDETIRCFGGVDILFNNAGVVLEGTAETTSETDWQYALDLNVTAVWRMSRLVLPHMRIRGGGVIINNASDWGLVGAPGALVYCTCKGAVVQMTRAMALDHARENIRINAVCPGDTIVERWFEEGYYRGSGAVSEEMVKAQALDLPLGRVAKAEEIARAVLFLASSDASFMTGATLVLDGGNTAR